MRRLRSSISVLAACATVGLLGPAASPVPGAGQEVEPMVAVPAAGHSFAYHVVGDGAGTPLLLINGGPGFDHQYLHMSDVWERFGASRRVVFFDQPGTGRSSPVEEGDTVSVADIRRHLFMSFYSPEIRERALSGLPVPVPFNVRQYGMLWGDAEAHPLGEAVAALEVPVLAATGRWDANVSARSTWNVHRLIPGSQWAVWERSGHYPMVEEPDAFHRVVEGFLRGDLP